MQPAAAPPTDHLIDAPPPVRGAGDPARPPKAKRRVRNYLLDTSLQLRMASYLLGVAAALGIGLGWLLWQAYRETSRVIALGDAEVGDSIATALASEDRTRIVLVSAALAAILVCLLAAAIVMTHRIAGPAFVIGRTCREVGEGKLARPRPLRARDLLVELADDVSGMVDALRDREGSERARLLQVIATLQDPAGAPADREAAAEELRRMVSEKESRLGS
jgi:HAMP domain-containing protein